MKYLAFFIFYCTSLFASDGFISTLELKEKLDDPKLLLIDVTPYATYKISHIKNAVHVDINSFVDAESPGLKSAEDIGTYLKDLGLRNDSDVVLYGRATSQDQLSTSYLAFILLSHGFSKVSLLDGGYMAWVFENELLVSTEIFSKEQEGDFEAKRNENFFITSDEINQNVESIKLLDSRKSSEYFGTSLSKGVTGVGHIPSAQSSFYQDKFLSDFTLRLEEELELLFVEGHKLHKDDTIVVYATDAREASMNWYLLYQHLGFRDVKLYEASMQEWGNDSELPLRKFLWECGK